MQKGAHSDVQVPFNLLQTSEEVSVIIHVPGTGLEVSAQDLSLVVYTTCIIPGTDDRMLLPLRLGCIKGYG